MRFAIAYYKNNLAGRNIIEQFKKLFFSPQIPIIELNKETIYSDDIDEKNYPELKNIDFLIFASTHKSKKGEPSLSLHSAGNWRSADLGGKPGKICRTSAFVLKYLFQKLEENAKNNKEIYEKYNITLEATHHGPFINIPNCFIELGSQENEWRDEKAAEVIAETISSLQNFDKKNYNWTPCIAIGGTHYCPNFNKIQLNSNYAISHIIPQYNFPVIEIMIKEAEEKTIENIENVLIDWKGCGKSEDRQKVLDLLEKTGLKYERTDRTEK
ncbi:MAG: D-aminoacyl-tRNA deacylase [Nanoarchaeota archaeon]